MPPNYFLMKFSPDEFGTLQLALARYLADMTGTRGGEKARDLLDRMHEREEFEFNVAQKET